MRNTLLLIFVTVLHANANDSYSQNTKLSLNLNNVTVANVLEEIQDNSEFYFLFNTKLIDVEREVSVTMEDKRISDILTYLFSGTGVNYLVYDRQIILTPDDVKPLAEAIRQQQKITGTVTDESGSPIQGATVQLKGTTIGVITDAKGIYILENVPQNATLIFSFIGMAPQEIQSNDQILIDVVLKEEAVGLGEVVVTGYGTQRKGNLTGSISSVKSDKLTIAPVASTSNALTGRVPGLIVQQLSGQPGYDAANLYIRGFGNALVIVDGIESDFNNIDANQIESISVLKDGAASIYGSRAGNGVILVTTKRGQDSKPVITLQSDLTYQGVTRMPQMMSSGQFSEIRRDNHLWAGLPEATAPHTAEEVQKYYDGSDPNYPNTDWNEVLLRDWAPQTHTNLSVRGGSEKIKYYGYLGHMYQESIWSINGGNYNRYNLQSNIDARITDNLSLQLDLSSSIEQRKTPYRDNMTQVGYSSTWGQFWNTWPIFHASYPDPTKVPYTLGQANTISSMDYNYSYTDLDTYKGTLSLNYNFEAIKGLSAKIFGNYFQGTGANKSFSKPVLVYTYDYNSDTYSVAGGSGSASMNQFRTKGTTVTAQASLNYERTFKADHKINVMAIYEAINYKTDSISAARLDFLSPSLEQLFAGNSSTATNYGLETEMGRKSYIGRINYSYKNKYLLEGILRADASAKFSEENRWGYFPSLSLGWRVSEEGFMQGISGLTDMKLRLSYGSSGNDNIGNFQYLAGFEVGNNYIIDGGVNQGIVSMGVPNENMTWEQIEIYNAGLDFTVLNRVLYGTVEAFYRNRSGILGTRATSLPSTFGADLPVENLNSINTRGFELTLGTANAESGDFKYDFSFNLSWSRSQWDHYEEPLYTDPDQLRLYAKSGTWTDRTIGYVAEGLFATQDEIDNLGYDMDLQGNISLKPGNIRFQDVNNDKKLDWKDQVEIGKGTVPHWMTGFNMILSYKNFSLNALFQGAFGYYTYISLPYSETAYKVRWTPETSSRDGKWSRGGGKDDLFSTYKYQKSGYLRLKTLNIGYDFSPSLLQKVNLEKLRLYVAGTNLFSIDGLKEWDIDPEAPTGFGGFYYPQIRTVTMGIIISL